MDVGLLATAAATVLGPLLGQGLATGGESAIESIGEKLGAGLFEQGKALLVKLRPKVEAKPGASEAASELAEKPDDADARTELVLHLKKILAADPDLAAEVEALVGRTAVGGAMLASASGGSATAQTQGPGRSVSAAGGGTAVGNDLTHIDQRVQVNVFQFVVRELASVAPAPDLEKGMARYQSYLLARHTNLEFRGMGVDRLALHLPLLDVYVPGRARVRAPEGDSWTRDAVRLGGREPSSEEAAAIGERGGPIPVLDLLRELDGFVLLGDPGSGKSTFLKYLALTAARGESESLGLGLRLPLLAPLAAYTARLADEPGLGLQAFLAEQLEEQGVEVDAERLLAEGLRRGRLLILLDGLDEVADEALRHKVATKVKDFYCAIRPDGNKLVATSRIVGYAEVRLQAEGLGEGTLVDFDQEEIEAFVTAWTAAVERSARGQGDAAAFDAERERKGLLAAIGRDLGVARLAANPLLLTILALMKRQGVELPERRAELYATYVRVLIHQWNLARSISGEAVAGLDVGETLDLLAPLALWMQETSGARGMVPEEALRDELVRLLASRGEKAPTLAATKFLADVRRHTALLIDRGGRVFGFIHLTFQEYLAAVALVRTAQIELAPLIDALAERVGRPDWLEVIRLSLGDLARDRPEAAGKVLQTLLDRGPGAPGEVEIFAGLAALDIGRKGLPAEARKHAAGALLKTLRDDQRVPARVRARVGEVLADLGDPRSGVTTLAGMEFCWVPAGPFWMGSREEDEEACPDEKPQHEVTLGPYAIGRYPVTVAQYAEYVERSGEQPGYPEALLDPANAPVVGVSWHEVVEFCHWLTGTWRGEGKLPAGWEVVLPSEAEWEKAARGGLSNPAAPSFIPFFALPGEYPQKNNPSPKRIYPWDGAFEANRTNSITTEIGRVCATGCFPGGASPYGVEELLGNVWEWTRSLFERRGAESDFGYPYVATDGRENLESSSRRVLRGGAFNLFSASVRCAARTWDGPDDRSDVLGFRVVVSPIPL